MLKKTNAENVLAMRHRVKKLEDICERQDAKLKEIEKRLKGSIDDCTPEEWDKESKIVTEWNRSINVMNIKVRDERTKVYSKSVKEFFMDEGWNEEIAQDVEDIYNEADDATIDCILQELDEYCVIKLNDPEHDYRLELLPHMTRFFVINNYWGAHL